MLRPGEQPASELDQPEEITNEETAAESARGEIPQPVDDENQDRPLERGQIRAGEQLEEGAERPNKRHKAELLGILYQQLESVMTNRKRKETSYRTMDKKTKAKFDKAILKEINNNLKSGADQALTTEESEKIRRDKPDLVMKSRYVQVCTD